MRSLLSGLVLLLFWLLVFVILQLLLLALLHFLQLLYFPMMLLVSFDEGYRKWELHGSKVAASLGEACSLGEVERIRQLFITRGHSENGDDIDSDVEW